MKLLNSAFTLSLLCSIAVSVFAQQAIPPSTEPRCVCMPGNSTGVLLKPGQMGVSSGQIESCPCVPKEDKDSKEDKKSDEGSDKSNAAPDANTSSDNSTSDAHANNKKGGAESDASTASDNPDSGN